jgi:hypothetical protein
VRDSRYQGGFEHPLRAFLIGVGFLVLLFGGFAVGIEMGTHPDEAVSPAVKVMTVRHGHTVTVELPVARTVINGSTKFVTLPGSVRRRVIVIHKDGHDILAFAAPAGSTAQSGVAAAAADTSSTVYVSPPQTVTEPGTTVTETAPGSTVTETETVTAPPSSSDSGTTTSP